MSLRPTPLAMSIALLSQLAYAEHTIEVAVPTSSESAFSVSPAMALKELQKTPGGVAVVDSKDYLTGRAGSMEDTLKLATGVFIQSSFGSDEARLSIRGSGLQRNFHGRGLWLLQDGIPLNTADGNFDMEAIDPLATRYIEVERGANAFRFGAGTLGGALNYVSETGRSARPLTLRLEAGSFQYQRLNVSGGAQQGDKDAFFSLGYSHQDGFRAHSQRDALRFFGNVGLQLSDRVESRFYLSALETDMQLPGRLTYAQLRQDPSQANARAIARNDRYDLKTYRLANKTQVRHGNGQTTEFISYVSLRDLYHPIEFFPTGPGIIEQGSTDWGVGVRHLMPTTLFSSTQTHLAGLQWRQGLIRDERYGYANNAFSPSPGNARGAIDNRQRQRADQLDAYVQSNWMITHRLTAVAGIQQIIANRRQTVRDDGVCFDSPTATCPGSQLLPTAPYDRSYQRTLPRVGFIYALDATTQAYGNISGSFEPPTFIETSNNKPLKAQRAMTYELGLRGARQLENALLSWDTAAYVSNVRNEQVEIALGNQSLLTSAPYTRHQGVELGVAADGVSWRAKASYLWNDFKFREGADTDQQRGNAIAGIPTQVLAAEAALRLAEGTWFGPTLRAASRSWVDHANTLYAPGYAIWGLKLNHVIDRSTDLFIEGRNLGDRAYAATHYAISNAKGEDQAQFLPGETRSIYAGVTKRF